MWCDASFKVPTGGYPRGSNTLWLYDALKTNEREARCDHLGIGPLRVSDKYRAISRMNEAKGAMVQTEVSRLGDHVRQSCGG
jgi:hypothetical protein